MSDSRALELGVDNVNIVLTGFMGTGKTTVGQRLAKRLGRQWVDTDRVIVERHGPIAELFATKGENVFRDIERAVAVELAAISGLVISTGGGTLIDPAAAAALTATGRVFCLVADPDEILRRVHRSDRPLLTGEDLEANLSRLLDERAIHYLAFTQIETTGRTVNEVVEAICLSLQTPD